MAIRNTENGATGGIGAVRYVEKGVTINLPIGYTVEGGKTVLVYKEEVVPTGDTYCLYDNGAMSKVLGGITYEGDCQITVTEETDHLAIRCPAGATMGGKLKSRLMNLHGYNEVNVEYEYVNASTGETITGLWNNFNMWCLSEEGVGSNAILNASVSSVSCLTAASSQQYIQFAPSYKSAVSDEYDVILKIYSIRVEK